MRYTIIHSHLSIEELIEKVNELIQEGYEPIGGMVIYLSGFYQTMLKRVAK